MRKSTHSRKTFGFTSFGDVLAKLDRELARLHSAKSLEDAADHASNAAVTAWHLSEWAWAALRKGGHIGPGSRWHSVKEFQEWLIVEGCIELGHCLLLANSFKHLGHNSSKSVADFTAQSGPAIVEWVSSRGEKNTFVNSKGEPIYFTSGSDSQWWITEGDKKYSANQLFGKAMGFWRDFLDRYAIG